VRIILFLLAAITFGISAEVIITSNNFEGDDASGVSKFFGNAKATKGADIITSSEFIVYTDSKRKIQKIEAIGDAKFTIVNDNLTYKGYADKLVYYPNKKEYELIGNAMAENIEEKRKVFGDYIVINNDSKKATVRGNEAKPARFIFFIDDENKSKK
jgi:lipopolysaccharide export system protein LptA